MEEHATPTGLILLILTVFDSISKQMKDEQNNPDRNSVVKSERITF